MNSKLLISAVCAVVVVVIAAAVCVTCLDHDDETHHDDHHTYNTTYNGNGGYTLDGKSTFTSNASSVLNNMFTYDDCIFIGWNFAKDGSESYYEIGNDALGNGTLYAIWGSKITWGIIGACDPFGIATSTANDLDTVPSAGESKSYVALPYVDILMEVDTFDKNTTTMTVDDITDNKVTFTVANSTGGTYDGKYIATFTITGATLENPVKSAYGFGIAFSLSQTQHVISISVSIAASS